jgi:hypothetical protein
LYVSSEINYIQIKNLLVFQNIFVYFFTNF